MVDLSIAPESAPLATPDLPMNATPEAYGAGLAAAGAQAGHQLVQIAVQRKEIDERNRYEVDLTAGQLRLAQLREQMAAQVNALQGDHTVSVDDYAKRVGAAFDQLAGAVTEGQTNQRIQRQLAGQVGEMRAQYGEAAQNWQSMKRAVLFGQGANALGETMEAQAYQAPNPQTVESLQLQWAEYAHALNGLQPDQRSALVHEKVASMASAFGRGLANRDPYQTKALVAGGWFGQHGIKGEQLAAIDRAADVEIRARENEVKAQQQLQRTDAERTVEQAIGRVHDGAILDDHLLATYEAQATALGLSPVKLDELKDARAQNRVKNEFRAASPETIAAELSRLDTKIAQAGTQADFGMVQRRNHVQAVLEQRRREIGADQAGWAARNGIDAPQVDWDHPDANVIMQRVKAIDLAAQSAGIAPEARQYFSADDVQRFKGGLGSKDGFMGAIAAAKQFGGARSAVAAGQLKPGDANFAYLTTLPVATAGAVWDGLHHLKQFPAAITIPKEEVRRTEWLHKFGEQDRWAMGALMKLDAQQRGAFFDTARNLLAGFVAQGEPLTPNLRWRALNQAIGASGKLGPDQRGGFAMWGSTAFLLPRTMTDAQFKKAATQAWAASPPVDAGGKAYPMANAHPVRIGPSKYRFDTVNGMPLRRRDHSVFTLDIKP